MLEGGNFIIKMQMDINKLFTQLGNLLKGVYFFIKSLFGKHHGVNLKKLTCCEKDMIKKYYSYELHEFIRSGQTIQEDSKTYPVITKLCERNILIPLNQLEKINNYNGSGVVYYINSKAVKKINKPKYKKNILVQEKEGTIEHV